MDDGGQLQERYKGNEQYRAGRLQEALQHYNRAQAIIDYVSGASPADQAEVDVNRVAVYLNLAAVRLSLKQYRQATQDCTKALELQPRNAKALLRRSKAFMYLHEYGVRPLWHAIQEERADLSDNKSQI